MKFDIIAAIDIAEAQLQLPCTVIVRKLDDVYTVQIKVTVPYPHPTRGSKVYGQQFEFRNHPGLNSDWFHMNEEFNKAIYSLKSQIEEGA